MKASELLKKIAQNAGIIQTIEEVEPVQGERKKAVTISLEKLIEEKNVEDFSKSVEAPELDVDFSSIYKVLKVVPPLHGWDVDKILEIINSAPVKDHARAETKKMLLEMLAKNNIPLQDVIKDAVNRNHALDTYEQFVFKKHQDRGVKRDERIDSLKKQIEECQGFIEQLKSAQTKDAEEFSQWTAKKISKEEELAYVASLLTTEEVISVGQVTKEKPKH